MGECVHHCQINLDYILMIILKSRLENIFVAEEITFLKLRSAVS